MIREQRLVLLHQVRPPRSQELHELSLALPLLFDDVARLEGREHVLRVLQRVGQPEDAFLQQHLVLGLLGRVRAQQRQLGLELLNQPRHAAARVVDGRLADAVPVGVPGIAGDKRDVSFLHTAKRHAQVVRRAIGDVRRVELAVRAVPPDVGAQDGDVGHVGKAEIHFVATEVAELLLGRVDEPDVVEVLVDDQL